MTAVLVVAALVLGAVASALLHRIAGELARAAVVVCDQHTRVWDPARRLYVHRTHPGAQLRAVLIGAARPRRPPHVERRPR